MGSTIDEGDIGKVKLNQEVEVKVTDLVGVIFGIIPALRASQLKQVDALKYE